MARRKSGLAMILGIIFQAILLSHALQDDCPSSVQVPLLSQSSSGISFDV